jgi:hypothetical protein
MKGDQVTGLPRLGKQRGEPGEGKHSFGKLLAQYRVVEPALVLHGKQREPGHEPLREHAPPAVIGRLAARTVTRDAVDAAARRLGLEDIAVKPGGQRQRRHGRRVIRAAASADQVAVDRQP